jgi:Phage integrase family/Transposase zinc-binding domain
MTAYAAGLRVAEVAARQVSDIDSQRMVLRVRQGKGRKDRYVMLSPVLLEILRADWKLAPPQTWLFPNPSDDGPLTPAAVMKACRPGRFGPGEARHRPHPAAQLRHPPARGRHRPEDQPGPARPRQPARHGGLHPRLAGGRAGDRQPPGPTPPAARRGTPAVTRPQLEVADVIRAHGEEILDASGDTLSPEQRRALIDLPRCRTVARGGHVEACDRCGHHQVASNSGRNRH